MPVLLADIAERVGISKTAVCRVINGHRRGVKVNISPARQAEVLRVAKELGYQPHAGASALRRQRFNRVGLLMPFNVHGIMYGIPAMWKIMAELSRQGLGLSLVNMTPRQVGSLNDADIFQERGYDALIVAAQAEAAVQQSIQAIRLPKLMFNIGEVAPQGCIIADDFEIGYLTTRLAIEAGHRRLAVGCAGVYDQSYERLRFAGARCAIAEAGLTRSAFFADKLTDPLWPDWLAGLLKQPNPPTAIVAMRQLNAIAAYEMLVQHGLLPGRQVSVLCMDGSFQNRIPKFNGMWLDQDDMGILVAERIGDLLRNPKQVLANQWIKAQWSVGHTLSTPDGQPARDIPPSLASLRLALNDPKRKQYEGTGS